jgi:prophage tail gpP-like protein
MSGIFLPPTTGIGTTDAVLRIGSTAYTGWKTVSITRSAELFPNSFIFTGSDPAPDDPSQIIAEPGTPCQVLCGQDVVVTGYIDRFGITIGPRQHDVYVTGRGLCQDLTDCSADLTSPACKIVGGSISAVSTLDLAQRLAASFNITCRSAVSDLGVPIPAFQVTPGETPYEIIETAARYSAFLITEDEHGALVLDRVGTSKMTGGITTPGNVEGAQTERAIDLRYSDYVVYWNTLDQIMDGGGPIQAIADIKDPTVKRFRPYIIRSEQIQGTDPIAVGKQRANWEMARRLGRSQSVTATVDSWRDSAGELWRPNALATINAPQLKLVNQEWVIVTVTFRKDLTGTHAELVLMPPRALDPQPNPLVLFDPELTSPRPSSQNPGPG